MRKSFKITGWFFLGLLTTNSLFGGENVEKRHFWGVGVAYFTLRESSPSQDYQVSSSAFGFLLDYLYSRPQNLSIGVKAAYHSLLSLSVQQVQQSLKDKYQNYYLLEASFFYPIVTNFHVKVSGDLFYTGPFYFSGQKLANSSGLDIYSALGVYYTKSLAEELVTKFGFDIALNLTPIRGQYVGLNNMIALRYRFELSILYGLF